MNVIRNTALATIQSRRLPIKSLSSPPVRLASLSPKYHLYQKGFRLRNADWGRLAALDSFSMERV
jgi:hypothetical protein